jgi:serine/threonine-protein kinase
LAETYVIFPRYSIASPKDSMPPAKAAAMRALEIDEQLAEAHAALGKYLFFYEFDRAGGEREYRRAIELKPNYPTAHQWLASDILANMKRFDEAVTEMKRAEELDPLTPIIATDAGFSDRALHFGLCV